MIRPVTVADGLRLDPEMYETTVAALQRVAPEVATKLSWERFTRRESWTLVPDANRPQVPFYKAELVLLERAPWTRALKVNVWVAPDLRRDGAPMPHNHPWPFNAHVLLGGYKEDRYALNDGHVDNREHKEGDINEIPLTTFHEVTEILVPGRTLTLMDCGKGTPGTWGYLDPDTGQFTRDKPDPAFMTLLRDRNPHMG
jgi:hypothetical protein